MQNKFFSSTLAFGIVSALLVSGCASTGESGTQNSPSQVSASPVKELSAIEKVRKEDPDNIDEKLTYKSIGQNSKGKYVVLGANPKSEIAEFDPKLWKETGKNWSKKEMAQAQFDAVDLVYASMFSGPGVGGNDADHAKHADETIGRMDKTSLAEGGDKVIREAFAGPDAQNPFLIATDPKESNSLGYEVYQDENSSRYLNAKANLVRADSYDKGYEGPMGVATADIATIEVSVLMDKKLVKNDETYSMPIYVSYFVNFINDKGKIAITGISLSGSDFRETPTKVNF